MARRHLHTYRRVQTGAGLLWKCIDPKCNHYMPEHLEKTLIGRMARCASCGEEFIIYSIVGNEGTEMKCPDCRLAGNKSFDEIAAEIEAAAQNKQ